MVAPKTLSFNETLEIALLQINCQHISNEKIEKIGISKAIIDIEFSGMREEHHKIVLDTNHQGEPLYSEILMSTHLTICPTLLMVKVNLF